MSFDVYRPARSSWTLGLQSPADEPVSVTFVRDHTNLTDADDLVLLESMISQAREIVELETNRVMLTTACVLKLDRFPAIGDLVIELPGGVCQGVDAITYIDPAGVERTWATDQWVLDAADTFGNARLGPARGVEWPAVEARGLAVTIEYTAGWNADTAVPAALRGAIAKVAATLYDERHATSDGSALTSSRWFRAMISRWRVFQVV